MQAQPRSVYRLMDFLRVHTHDMRGKHQCLKTTSLWYLEASLVLIEEITEKVNHQL